MKKLLRSLSVKSVSSVVKKTPWGRLGESQGILLGVALRVFSIGAASREFHEALRAESVTEGHRRKQANRLLTTNRRVARCRRRFPLECTVSDLTLSGKSASSCQRQQIS